MTQVNSMYICFSAYICTIEQDNDSAIPVCQTLANSMCARRAAENPPEKNMIIINILFWFWINPRHEFNPRPLFVFLNKIKQYTMVRHHTISGGAMCSGLLIIMTTTANLWQAATHSFAWEYFVANRNLGNIFSTELQ